MTIKFNLNYQTTFGEELLLNVKVMTEDGQEKTAVFSMSTTDGHHGNIPWTKSTLHPLLILIISSHSATLAKSCVVSG